MNPILILSHNTYELTRRCVESCLAQDCGDILISLIDNDSSDQTYEWAKQHIPLPRSLVQFRPQIGVSAGWNIGLKHLFVDEGAAHVFVVNSDTILPSYFCRAILSEMQQRNLLFASGQSVEHNPPHVLIPQEPVPSPDFSAYCISKTAWERIGEFEETMRLYASDNDYHLRAHRAGVHLWNALVPFYHERSSTLRLASPRDRREIELQADADRVVFREKWGFDTWSPQYAAAFTPETFGIDHPTIREMQDL